MHKLVSKEKKDSEIFLFLIIFIEIERIYSRNKLLKKNNNNWILFFKPIS